MKSQLPLAEYFSAEYLEYHSVLPLEIRDGRLIVAVAETPADEVLEDLAGVFGRPLETLPTDRAELLDAIQAAFRAVPELAGSVDLAASGESDVLAADVRDLATQPPVIRFVNRLLRDASEAGASDLHLDSRREGLEVRFRLDGVLQPVPAPPGLQVDTARRSGMLRLLDGSNGRSRSTSSPRTRVPQPILPTSSRCKLDPVSPAAMQGWRCTSC